MSYLKVFLDPTVLAVVAGVLIKLLVPLIDSMHLNKKENNILNATKRAVTYASQQTGLDNDARRKLAEESVLEWVQQHNVKIDAQSVSEYVEYSYQMLKNGKEIDIKPYAEKVADTLIDKGLTKGGIK
ncbi:phage holin, LLH family [Fructilactobacillus vespulae]|uniref:phage holin, LLH family n=1 Tax=Fructilactobacillus vespulae TaxID=1249630 RepID=UPI0039B4C786